MSTIDEERAAYENNPYFTGHIYSDFSPFYVTIAICTIVIVSIILLNVVLSCCSKHRNYWKDRHTGNRWLVSIWSTTPHLQPPLDFTELKDASYFERFQPTTHSVQEDIEAQKVSIHQTQKQRPPRPEGHAIQHHRNREEYVELQKRESDI